MPSAQSCNKVAPPPPPGPVPPHAYQPLASSLTQVSANMVIDTSALDRPIAPASCKTVQDMLAERKLEQESERIVFCRSTANADAKRAQWKKMKLDVYTLNKVNSYYSRSIFNICI